MFMENFVAREGFEHLTEEDLKNMTVGAHWNAHTKTFSIVEMKSKRSEGKVIGYSDYLVLKECYVFIKKSEQKKVHDGSCKTRHAFICGKIDSFTPTAYSDLLYYNPKEKLKGFVDKLTYIIAGKAEYIHEMDYVAMAKNHEKNIPFVSYKR